MVGRWAWWSLVGLGLVCGVGLELRAQPAAPAASPPAEIVVPALPAPSPLRRILLITLDALRADHVGAPVVHTPAFDRLVLEGTWVADATTPIPSTGPAHASLLTGLHPWRHGVLRDAQVLAPEHTTFVEHAADAGIATAAFVSTALLHPQFGFAQGFDRFRFAPTEFMIWRGKRRENFWSRGEATTSAAIDWITEHQAESFVAWVHLFDVHAPYLPPPEFVAAPDAPVDLAGKLVPAPLRGPDALALAIRRYRGEVRYADHQVGRLLTRLDELGILDDTYVVLTADHGEGLGDHGWLEHDDNLFDELVRVPLIVRGPGIPAARRVVGPAQLEDLPPTLLAALGLAPEPDLDGMNLLPWLRGERAISPRRTSLGQRGTESRTAPLFYVRTGGTKWIGDPATSGKAFDLALDPREFSGLADAGVPNPLAQRLAALPAEPEAPAAETMAEAPPPSLPPAASSKAKARTPAKPAPPHAAPKPAPRAGASPAASEDTPAASESERRASAPKPTAAEDAPKPSPEPAPGSPAKPARVDEVPPLPPPLPEPAALQRKSEKPSAPDAALPPATPELAPPQAPPPSSEAAPQNDGSPPSAESPASDRPETAPPESESPPSDGAPPPPTVEAERTAPAL
jgi:arylsulfatase A-like enzyme